MGSGPDGSGLGRAWRCWAALCLILGTVVVPLFWEVFSAGSILRFAGLPIRYAWFVLLALPLLRERWISPRWVAVALLGFSLLITGMTLINLFGLRFIHPGWFLALEWWQRPLYPWIEVLPRWTLLERPGYLWTVSLWHLLEGAVVAHLLFWRVGAASAVSDE